MTMAERLFKGFLGIYGLIAIIFAILSLFGFKIFFVPFVFMLVIGLIVYAIGLISAVLYVCVKSIREAIRGY